MMTTPITAVDMYEPPLAPRRTRQTDDWRLAAMASRNVPPLFLGRRAAAQAITTAPPRREAAAVDAALARVQALSRRLQAHAIRAVGDTSPPSRLSRRVDGPFLNPTIRRQLDHPPSKTDVPYTSITTTTATNTSTILPSKAIVPTDIPTPAEMTTSPDEMAMTNKLAIRPSPANPPKEEKLGSNSRMPTRTDAGTAVTNSLDSDNDDAATTTSDGPPSPPPIDEASAILYATANPYAVWLGLLKCTEDKLMNEELVTAMTSVDAGRQEGLAAAPPLDSTRHPFNEGAFDAEVRLRCIHRRMLAACSTDAARASFLGFWPRYERRLRAEEVMQKDLQGASFARAKELLLGRKRKAGRAAAAREEEEEKGGTGPDAAGAAAGEEEEEEDEGEGEKGEREEGQGAKKDKTTMAAPAPAPPDQATKTRKDRAKSGAGALLDKLRLKRR